MKVWAIHEDSDGGLWFGTRNNGLFRLRDGKHRALHRGRRPGQQRHLSDSRRQRRSPLDERPERNLACSIAMSLTRRPNRSRAISRSPFTPSPRWRPTPRSTAAPQSSGCITAQGDVWFPSNRGPIHILPFAAPLAAAAAFAHPGGARRRAPRSAWPGPSSCSRETAAWSLPSRPSSCARRTDCASATCSTASTKTGAPPPRRAPPTTPICPPAHYRFRVRDVRGRQPRCGQRGNHRNCATPLLLSHLVVHRGLCCCWPRCLFSAVYQYRVRQVRARFEAVLERAQPAGPRNARHRHSGLHRRLRAA